MKMKHEIDSDAAAAPTDRVAPVATTAKTVVKTKAAAVASVFLFYFIFILIFEFWLLMLTLIWILSI